MTEVEGWVDEVYGLCPVRDRCMVPVVVKRCKDTVSTEKARADLGVPCGFELAGTVKRCPKRGRLEVVEHENSPDTSDG